MEQTGRAGALTFLLLLSGCGSSGTAVGVPPCNAWIFLFGAADLQLDCPATNAVKLFERTHTPANPP